jgi:glycerophosphoryl diester phosphodiesterase
MSARWPIIVGHRGAAGLAPENTLRAFQVANALRIDGVEFDVQRTQDGHLIVFHDDMLDRVTDGTGKVAHATLDEIRSLDAGSKFDPLFRGELVPTLRETFEYLVQTDLLVFLELKDPWRYPGIEQAAVDLIREYDLAERVQVRSFHHPALHTLYRLAPDLRLSELWGDHLPTADEAGFRTINALYRLYTAENIAQIHARGQQATAWTVNDPDAARRLIDAGIDGLTTDYPDRLLALFGA